MISARVADGKIFLESDYPLRDRDRIKKIPGTRYTDKSGWTAPLTWATCIQLRAIFGEAFIPADSSLPNWANKELDSRIQPGLELRQKMDIRDYEDPVITGWRGKQVKYDLYPFQEAGVKFLATARTAYLCDEMGTGKTCQTISTLRYLAETNQDPFPAIIVAPTSLTRVWEREFALWFPGAKVSRVSGNVTERRAAIASRADVLIINYESVRAHSRLTGYGDIKLQGCVVCDKTINDPKRTQAKCEKCDKELNKIQWRTVVVDESHRMKDPKAKQTRAIWSLAKPAYFRYALSGTALTEAPGDLWGALHFLQPESYSSRGHFLDRYCEIGYNPFGGMTIKGLQAGTKPEFFAIIDPFMRRMPKAAVLPFLPEKTYVIRETPMTPAQKRQYTQLKKGMLAELDNGILMVTNPLTKVTRLDQIASACMEEDGEGGYRMTNPSCKVTGLLELLEDMGSKPLVVFSASRQLLELVKVVFERDDISYSEIVGGQTGDQRDKAVNDFQGGKVRVILCMTGAGGEGLTLTRADTVCFLQRPWKMSQSKQAEDRVHRIGAEAHENILVIDLITPGTVEERRMSVLAGKEENLEEVMRDEAFIRMLLEEETNA